MFVMFYLILCFIEYFTELKNKTMYIKMIRQGDHYIYSGSFIRKNSLLKLLIDKTE